ncbi:hypothetical protein P5673_013676 [Acropora cervicornis]|uniref:Uncharacterized protein n=1 Tax=Acropora cervicornis TaxID=6130 RepID=A0AAD9QL73_ACRCE|nr:hypothetical protein P5673_013676 [Acropora cervicornis]
MVRDQSLDFEKPQKIKCNSEKGGFQKDRPFHSANVSQHFSYNRKVAAIQTQDVSFLFSNLLWGITVLCGVMDNIPDDDKSSLTPQEVDFKSLSFDDLIYCIVLVRVMF